MHANKTLLCALLAALLHDAGAAELHLAEALRLALSGNAEVQVQRARIEAARGSLLQESGRFDLLTAADASFSRQSGYSSIPGLDQIDSHASGYQLSATQPLRSGASLGLSLGASANSDNSGASSAAPGAVTLAVNLRLPLLKGRGAAEVAAAEDAAALNVEVSRLVLRDRVANLLYQTLSAYWTYRVRAALVQVSLSSEARSRELLSSNEKLVAAEEKPRADLVLLQADLADKMAARQAAQLALVDARSALGRLLGLDGVATAALAEAADPLPAAQDVAAPAPAQLAQLCGQAQQQRPDLGAYTLQISAAERLASAARRQLLPAVDLNLGLSSTRLSDSARHFPWPGDSGRTLAGPALALRLSVQFPLQNRSARGLLLERSATLTQLGLEQRDLAAAIATGVDSAWQALASSAAQLKVAQQALALYEQAVSQELVKQRNGIATLIDVVNVETRYINARTSYLLTHLAYANAMARLRLETGTLLPPAADGDVDRFDLNLAQLAGLGPLAPQLLPSPSRSLP